MRENFENNPIEDLTTIPEVVDLTNEPPEPLEGEIIEK
jgi:hypothetical protein